MSEQLRELADHRLPEIDALIERAPRVRTWPEAATERACRRIDECALFDDARRASAEDARTLAVLRPGGPPAPTGGRCARPTGT